jgi:glycosyltransferase involved in cell wall biosynthesis/O-antigen/teichoic acid export membrane protein
VSTTATTKNGSATQGPDLRRSSLSIRELGRGTIPLLLALGLLNASNYIFHVAVSRLLGPVEYGALAALLAVVMVLSVPLSVAQTVVAKRTAQLRANGRDGEIDDMAAQTGRVMLWFGIVGMVILTVLSPLLAWFLHTEAGPAALLGPYWLVSLVLSIPLGVLQGRLRFGWLGGVSLIGVAARLAVGVGLVWAGAGVMGAMLGTVLAQASALLVALLVFGVKRATWQGARASMTTLRGEFGPALLTLGSFWLLAELDVILARRFLEGQAAGFYAGAGLLARALLFLPAAISMVALPRFAESSTPEEARRRLRVALLAVGGLVVMAYPVLALLREPVVALAFGQAFAPAADLLPLLAAGMGFMAVIGLLVFFHIAEGTKAYRLMLAAILLETVLISIFHGDGFQIGWIVLGVAAATAGIMYHAAVAACRWRPQPVVSDTAGEPGLNGDATVDLSVVLPCHNAGRGLKQVLTSLEKNLEHVDSWEVIVVSDGSTDDTVSIAERFPSEQVRVVHEPLRVGKGHALRLGMARARGRYIAFMDGDGDIDPVVLRPFLTLMELYEPDVILGSKRHPLSEVQYPLARRMMSWTYHKLCRLLFRVNVRDTQTGMKLIRRQVLADVLPRMLEKRYAFDLEFLVVARRLGYTRIFEAPIKLDYRFESQVAPSAVARILLDTLAIYYRRYILNTYLLADASQPGPDRVPHTEKLRILFLNWRDIRNPDAGGAEMVTHEVSKRWVQQGHHVSLLTSGFRGAPKAETIDGVRIRRMGRLRRGTFHLQVMRELSRLHGFDVVIESVNTIPFFTPIWRRRLPPTVTLVHQLAADVWKAEAPRSLASLGQRLEPLMLRPYRGARMVTVSESTRMDLTSLGIEDVTVVPNGRDEPPVMDDVQKEPVPTILYVGRLAANKRPDHAVRAFRHVQTVLPTARLWIVGRGPMEQAIRTSLPENVELLGYLSRPDVYRRMARAHCLIVPSTREGWGLTVVEANSVGTPAVAYDVPGLRDSVRHNETGLLVQAGNVSDLAAAAISILVDRDIYSEFRSSAQRWSKRFTWDLTASLLLKVCERARDQASEWESEESPHAKTTPTVAAPLNEALSAR